MQLVANFSVVQEPATRNSFVAPAVTQKACHVSPRRRPPLIFLLRQQYEIFNNKPSPKMPTHYISTTLYNLKDKAHPFQVSKFKAVCLLD